MALSEVEKDNIIREASALGIRFDVSENESVRYGTGIFEYFRGTPLLVKRTYTYVITVYPHEEGMKYIGTISLGDPRHTKNARHITSYRAWEEFKTALHYHRRAKEQKQKAG